MTPGYMTKLSAAARRETGLATTAVGTILTGPQAEAILTQGALTPSPVSPTTGPPRSTTCSPGNAPPRCGRHTACWRPAVTCSLVVPGFGEGTGNDQFLDVACALVDAADPRVAKDPLDRVILEITIAAVHLNGLTCDLLGDFGGV